MDQNQASNNINLNREELAKSIFEDLGVDNIPEEKKQALMENVIDMLMQRIFTRIAGVMTDEDEKVIEELKQRQDSEMAINEYVVGRVPNMNTIAAEEIEKLKKELKNNFSTLTSASQTTN